MSKELKAGGDYGHAGRPGQQGGSAQSIGGLSQHDSKQLVKETSSYLTTAKGKPTAGEIAKNIQDNHGYKVTPATVKKHLS